MTLSVSCLRPWTTVFALATLAVGTVMIAAGPAGATTPDDCPGTPFDVVLDTQAELNAAIDCFNTVTTAGDYTLTIDGDISYTAAATNINNFNSGVKLIIEGQGFTLDANGFSGVLTVFSGDLTVKYLTLTDGSSIYGGGLQTGSGEILLWHSTVSGNTATFAGGGLASTGGSISIYNSTISGNTAASYGGGVHNEGTSGPVQILHSTITENSAPTGSGVTTWGDSSVTAGTGGTFISASIVAANTGGGAQLELAFSTTTDTFVSGGFNVIGSVGTGMTTPSGTDTLNNAPNLGPLTKSGGDLTADHDPLTGSVAIDHVTGALPAYGQPNPVADDQNNTTVRPFGPASDAGSVESTVLPVGTITIFQDETPADGTDFGYDITGPGVPVVPVFEIQWGSSGTGPGQFNNTNGVTTDSAGNVYVADNSRVQKFNSSGVLLMTIGSFGTGDGQLDIPMDVAVNSDGAIYVADANNNRIQVFDSAGVYQFQWGSSGTATGQFNFPSGIALADGGDLILVADYGNNRIQAFDAEGGFQFEFDGTDNGGSALSGPRDAAVDPDGNIVVGEYGASRVQVFDSAGDFIQGWGTAGPGIGQFLNVTSVATDFSGNVYVTDNLTSRVQKFDSAGAYIGEVSVPSTANVTATVDPAGVVYATSLHSVHKFESLDAFFLDDASPDDGDAIGIQKTLTNVAAGEYEIDQGETPGSKVGSASCVGGADAGLLNDSTLTVDLAAGENITCTISNVVDVCTGFPFTVTTYTELNTAFNCFNAVTAKGEYEIIIGNDIAYSGPINVINNPFSGIKLLISGQGYELDANGHSGVINANTGFIDIRLITLTGGNQAFGGGLRAGSGQVIMYNSTVTGNTAASGGGLASTGSSIILFNSTVSGNTATLRGGGVYNESALGPLWVVHSTITNNSAPEGSGISSWGSPTVAPPDAGSYIQASIVSGNTGGGTDLELAFSTTFDSFISGGFNVIGSVGTGMTAPSGTDVLDPTPSLAPLTKNPGDFTADHNPLLGSPAIDLVTSTLPILDNIPLEQDQNHNDGRPSGVHNDAGSTEATATLTIELDATPPDGTNFGFNGVGGSIRPTFEGVWDSTVSQIFRPSDGETDSLGNLYITQGSKVNKLSPAGVPITSWGSVGTANGQFGRNAIGIAIDGADNVYVADAKNHRIQKFDSSGNFLLAWGTPITTPGSPADGEFDLPISVATDAAGNLYVTDLTSRIQKFDSSGNFLLKWGTEGTGNGQFFGYGRLATDSANNVYLADTRNSRIQKFDSSGNFLLKWGSRGSGAGEFYGITSINVDAFDNVYVGGRLNMQKFGSDGTSQVFYKTLPRQLRAAGRTYDLTPLAVDSDGNMYMKTTYRGTKTYTYKDGRTRVRPITVRTVMVLSQRGLFGLDDVTPDDGDGFTKTRVFDDLKLGTYQTTEVVPAGWVLDGATCTGGSDSGTLTGAKLSVGLIIGDDVTCTFANSKLPPALTVVSPLCPLYDSVTSGDGPLIPGTPRTVQVSGSCGVPTGASAVVLTLTAKNPTGVGNLRVSAATVVPQGGVVNYTLNALDNTNTVTVPLSAAGQIDLASNNNASGVRAVVAGYYSSTGDLDYFPVTPCAVSDSRGSQGATGAFDGPFVGGTLLPDVKVVGTFNGNPSQNQGGGQTDCQIPASADVVVVNVVSIAASGTGGIGATQGGTVPTEPTTNFGATGLNNAAVAYVPVDAGGEIALKVLGTGTSEVRVVVIGYLDTTAGDSYTPVNPCAAFDSRDTIPGDTNIPIGLFAGLRTAGTSGVNLTGVTTYQATGVIPAAQGGETVCGVPTGATAVLINLVAIAPVAAGNFRAYDAGGSPTGGVLNFSAISPPTNNSNAVVVPLSLAGELDLFVNSPLNDGNPTVHARGVILGYYD